MIHLLIPMSGQGERYKKAGYTEPKPLIPVNGVPMIRRLLSHFPRHWPAHFVLAENHKSSELPKVLAEERPGARQVFIPPHKLGPGHAVLAALDGIPAQDPVLVSYCDYGMVWDATQFENFVKQSGCDACVVSYRGFHAHYLSPTKYAYSRMEGERVVEVREKGSFTDNRENEYASCGAYYFKSAKLLRKALELQAIDELSLNGEYYISLTVEALLRQNAAAHVRVFEISGFFQWGTPEDLKIFEYWEKTFNSYNKFAATTTRVGQILMPMAGKGSRFEKLTDVPKPLIPVFEKPMFRAALDSLPFPQKNVLVALKENSAALKNHLGPHSKIVELQETPPGQALSTEAGVADLDLEKDVIVSSCDHGIVLNPDLWKKFGQDPGCDAAIFTVRGYPGAVRTPKSYAYVVPADSNSEFPFVKSVSVKQPVSPNPADDHVLVGTFWFRTGRVLKEGIQELKKRDKRVNGELYLDSVFECLMEKGLKVKMIPLDGYICWGDPLAMAESVYWQEIFTCRKSSPRNKL